MTPPGCDSFGFTTFVCESCGCSFRDCYTLPEHSITDWQLKQAPTTEQEGLSVAYCDDCGKEFTRTEEKLPPPPETEPPQTTEAAEPTVADTGSYDRAQEQRTLWIILVLLAVCLCAVTALILINRKPKK